MLLHALNAMMDIIVLVLPVLNVHRDVIFVTIQTFAQVVSLENSELHILTKDKPVKIHAQWDMII
jgi:hypothetical protein